YVWVEGFVLDALCAVTAEHKLRGASRFIRDLRSLALRTGMRELATRAWLHQAELANRAPGPVGPLIYGVQNPPLRERLHRRWEELRSPPSHAGSHDRMRPSLQVPE